MRRSISAFRKRRRNRLQSLSDMSGTVKMVPDIIVVLESRPFMKDNKGQLPLVCVIMNQFELYKQSDFEKQV